MDENNSEKREGFFQRLINAVRNMFGGGDKKAADTTAVTTANASDLSRVEMLEMLVELGKENARLKADLEEKDRVIEKQNLFLQAARKSAPVLTMEEDVELDSFASINKGAAGAGEMDERAAAAEHKAAEAQARLREADRRAAEAQAKLKEIEAKIAEAEKKAEEAAAMVEDAERRAQAAEEKAVQAEQKLQAPDAVEDTTAQAEAAAETEKIDASAENAETAGMPVEESAADANPQEAPEEVEDAEESEEEFSEETEAESDDAEEAEAEDDDAEEAEAEDDDAEEAEAEDDDAEEAEAESDADEEDDFESPAPGSFAAMIAARAAEAALRGKTGSKERAEEKTIGEEPAVEAKAETVTWKPEEKSVQVAKVAEPVVEKVKEVPAKEEPKTERLERTTGRVSMREAARRAGVVKK